jgi:uncharacterized protein (DUF2225 family)
VISPRLGTYLGKKGYWIFPYKAVIYMMNIINQILSRRRQHLERRNDFIQIMVDHEEEVKHEEATDKQEEPTKKQDQQWGTLSKSMNERLVFVC